MQESEARKDTEIVRAVKFKVFEGHGSGTSAPTCAVSAFLLPISLVCRNPLTLCTSTSGASPFELLHVLTTSLCFTVFDVGSHGCLFRQQVVIAILVAVGVIKAEDTWGDYDEDDVATGLQVTQAYFFLCPSFSQSESVSHTRSCFKARRRCLVSTVV